MPVIVSTDVMNSIVNLADATNPRGRWFGSLYLPGISEDTDRDRDEALQALGDVCYDMNEWAVYGAALSYQALIFRHRPQMLRNMDDVVESYRELLFLMRQCSQGGELITQGDLYQSLEAWSQSIQELIALERPEYVNYPWQ